MPFARANRELMPADLAIYPSTHPEVENDAVYELDSGLLLYVGRVGTTAGLGLIRDSATVDTHNALFQGFEGFYDGTGWRANKLLATCVPEANKLVALRQAGKPIPLLRPITWQDGRIVNDPQAPILTAAEILERRNSG